MLWAYSKLIGQFAEAGVTWWIKIYGNPYWQSTTKQYFKEESLKIHKNSLKTRMKQFTHEHRQHYARSWQAGQQHSAVNSPSEEHWLVQGHASFQHWMGMGRMLATAWPLYIPISGTGSKSHSVFRTSMNLAEAFTETVSQFSFSFSALRLFLHFHRSWSQNIPDILLPTNAFWVCLCLPGNLTCNSLSV